MLPNASRTLTLIAVLLVEKVFLLLACQVEPLSKLYALVAKPEPASLAVTVTVTFPLVQSVGLSSTFEIVGAVLSILVILTVLAAEILPLLSLTLMYTVLFALKALDLLQLRTIGCYEKLCR